MGFQMFYGASYSSAEYGPCWFRKTRSRLTYRITSIFIPTIFCLINKTDSKAGLVSDKGGGSSDSADRRELERTAEGLSDYYATLALRAANLII